MYQNKIVFQRHSDIYTTFLSYQRLYHKMETKKWYVQNMDHAMYQVKIKNITQGSSRDPSEHAQKQCLFLLSCHYSGRLKLFLSSEFFLDKIYFCSTRFDLWFLVCFIMDSAKIHCTVTFYGSVFWKEWPSRFPFLGREGSLCGTDAVKLRLGRNIRSVLVKVAISFSFNCAIVLEELAETGSSVKLDVRYPDC